MMELIGLWKAGWKAREAFRIWRRRVRNRKRLKKHAELTQRGASPSEAVDIIEGHEMKANFFWNVFKGGIRHALTAGGSLLVSGGLASQDEVTAVVGALMTVVGFGFSVARKWLRNKRTGSSD